MFCGLEITLPLPNVIHLISEVYIWIKYTGGAQITFDVAPKRKVM
jgi:hypothetical protein